MAATGLALQMLGAIIANVAVGAYSAIPAAAILMLVSAWVAWLRFGRYAAQPVKLTNLFDQLVPLPGQGHPSVNHTGNVRLNLGHHVRSPIQLVDFANSSCQTDHNNRSG